MMAASRRRRRNSAQESRGAPADSRPGAQLWLQSIVAAIFFESQKSGLRGTTLSHFVNKLLSWRPGVLPKLFEASPKTFKLSTKAIPFFFKFFNAAREAITYGLM